MNICNYIANYLIKKNIILGGDKEIYMYGLFVILYNSFLVFDILLLGLLFNQLEFSTLFLLFWTPYRILVGGSHCSTPFRCWVFFNFYYLLSYFFYLYLSLFLIFVLNIVVMAIQTQKKIDNKFFIVLWISYFILIYILPSKYQLAMSVSYLMNSLLTIHQVFTTKKYII